MLPKLRGSAKQVAWAEKIRAGYLAAMAKHDADILEALMHSRTMRRGVADELRRQGRVFEFIRTRPDASWWIDHRSMPLQELATVAAREMR